MRRTGLAALFVVLLAGPASAQVEDIDFVRVVKSTRTITLNAGNQAIREVRGIQLGRQPLGAKRFEGDGRTPEGLYRIDYGNPDSAYHLSLHISYPSQDDARFAAERGHSAGGAIFIHGQPNDFAGERVPGDWTAGCIAVSDAEIETLWELIPDGTPIEIVP